MARAIVFMRALAIYLFSCAAKEASYQGNSLFIIIAL